MFNGDSETHSPGVAKRLITFFRPLCSLPTVVLPPGRRPVVFPRPIVFRKRAILFFEDATEGAALGRLRPANGEPFRTGRLIDFRVSRFVVFFCETG